jgi:hypothetical protein
MMKINHALLILRKRRAKATLSLIFLAAWVCWYIPLVDHYMAENFPKLGGFMVGISIICFAIIALLLLYWIARLCGGIWWLAGIKRRVGLTEARCPVTFRYRFKTGAYDFL